MSWDGRGDPPQRRSGSGQQGRYQDPRYQPVQPAEAEAPRRRRAGCLVAGLLVVVLVAVIGTFGYAYLHLQGNITSASVKGMTGSDPTESSTAAAGVENILLIGSDTRAGAGDLSAAGGFNAAGARSDTTILLHLSADRSRAIAVSIPRDSWVPIPSCTAADGTATRPITGTKFNEAFSEGGAACTIATVQALTQVKIDHYVVVDFAGFKNMVNALGGVPVCLKTAANDPKSGLVLPAGNSVVSGDQALAFVRARYTLGNGSDTGRIVRQQAFLSGLVQKATSTGTLVDLPKLYNFLDAATKSVTTDPGLASITALASLGRSVKSIKESDIAFVTVPTKDRGDGANLLWTPDAATLWDEIRNDQPLPGTPAATASPSSPSTGSPTTAAPLTVAPDGIRVQVLNATGTAGLAAKAAADLRAQGFVVAGTGNAPGGLNTTTVSYPGSLSDSSRTLAAAVPGSVTQLSTSEGDTLILTLGANYTGTTPVSVGGVPGPTTPSPSITARTANQNLCT